MEDVYTAGPNPTQTVELQTMFKRCGFSGADWVDIPAWLMFSVQVPSAGGGLVANQKQSVGSAQGADFFLRRIQTINFYGTSGPQVWARIKLPNGRYLQGGNSSGDTLSINTAGVLAPPPLGLVKPEVHCPAGSNFTIDLLNVTADFGGAADIVASVVFIGVYRYRLEKAC